MDRAEAGQIIGRARHTLRSHASELRWSPEPGDLRAAMKAILNDLAIVAHAHPDTWAEVNALNAHFAPICARGARRGPD